MTQSEINAEILDELKDLRESQIEAMCICALAGKPKNSLIKYIKSMYHQESKKMSYPDQLLLVAKSFFNYKDVDETPKSKDELISELSEERSNLLNCLSELPSNSQLVYDRCRRIVEIFDTIYSLEQDSETI